MSRGCVYNCSFCNEKKFWKNFRSKKPETVVKEIETDLDKYNLDSFLFYDSLINGDTKLLEKYCELIISKGINIYWSTHANIRNMDGALLKKIKNSGFREVGFLKKCLTQYSSIPRMVPNTAIGVQKKW